MNTEQFLTLGARVDYQNVRSYLEAHGWSRIPSRRLQAAIYRSGRAPAVEVQVPLDRDLIDYGEAMVAVARRIAEHEQRPAESILRDLLRPRRDLHRFALEGAETQDGGIHLENGLSLVNGVRKALLSSACSVKRPGTTFHPRMSLADAEAFLKGCRLGQTEVGSFVLTVEAPLEVAPPRPVQEESFGRRASLLLLRSVAHVASAVRAGEPGRVLEPALGEPVVSANLCEALVEMMPPDEGADLRLRSSWSPLLPVEPQVPSEVHVDRNMYESIEKLSHQLRPSRGAQPNQFVGRVVELMGEPGEHGEVEGAVVLQAQVEDELLKVRVLLGAADYRQATEAHLTQRYVTVKGVLRRGSRVHQLDQASHFELVGI
jgi:hypothetical protein